MSASQRSPSEEIPETLEIVHVEPRFAVANWGRYNLMNWRLEISSLGVALWTRAMGQLKQSHPGKRLGQLTFIEVECNFGQDASTFEASVEALKRFEDCLAGSAIVYAREGFWNAAMRGRVTSIYNESRTEVPYAVRPTLAEASSWLREQAPDLPVLTLPALTRAVESLRRAV